MTRTQAKLISNGSSADAESRKTAFYLGHVLRAARAAALLLLVQIALLQRGEAQPPSQSNAATAGKPSTSASPTPALNGKLAASPKSPASPPVHQQPRFLVVIDIAHGGTDSGARLSTKLLEKDYVLGLAGRLRSALVSHGITVLSDRESDTTISAVDRAQFANRTPAAACISLHATASGNGVHLFTSSLSEIPLVRFLPWDTAQGAYVDQSLRFSSEFDTAMTAAEIPVTLGRTAIQPLDNFTCPAVAVEIAPLSRSGHITPLSDAGYQNQVVAALAAAVEHWQKDWNQHP
jgi:N-acetylmuramoyl-L-alanine amidase